MVNIDEINVDEEAEKLYKRLIESANGGDLVALETLAQLCSDENCPLYDLEQSKIWWKKALEHGSLIAEKNLKELEFSAA